MDGIGVHVDRMFAVTTTSLYLVQVTGRDRSAAVKLANRQSSRIARHTDIAEGGVIAIGRYLQAVLPDTPETRTGSGLWSFRTSAIVGLFLDQNAAQACLHEGSRRTYDPRWISSSRVALKTIVDLQPAVMVFWDQIPARAVPAGIPFYPAA